MPLGQDAVSIDPDRLQVSLAELAGHLDDTDSLAVDRPSTRLAQVVAAAERVLSLDCVGILLLDEGGVLRAVAASDATAAELETIQALLHVGPGITALGTSGTRVTGDLRADYPQLAEHLDGGGAWAVVSAPIRVGDDNVGNLNAIITRPHDWTDQEVHAVEAFADVVSHLLRLSAPTTPPPAGSRS
jgi:hypothetical protein